MKIRNGFVSNSSSSSFIIADYRKKGKSKTDKVKLIIEMDLEKYISDFDLSELDWWGEDLVEKIKAALAKGATIKEIHASSDSGDGVELFLYEEGLNKVELPEGIEVLYGDR